VAHRVSELLGGVVAGLVASAIAWCVGRVVRWQRNRDDFGSLAGAYDVSEKETGLAVGTVAIHGHGPILNLEWTHPDGSQASGRIAMNEQSRVTGSGSYEHRRGSNVGWGYFMLQVASRERDAVRLLVDGTFTDQELRRQTASAWVWEKR
jgi:hypothetical protein